MGTVIRIRDRKKIQVRPPRHTGEDVFAEPLTEFLRKNMWLRPDSKVPAVPNHAGKKT